MITDTDYFLHPSNKRLCYGILEIVGAIIIIITDKITDNHRRETCHWQIIM